MFDELKYEVFLPDPPAAQCRITLKKFSQNTSQNIFATFNWKKLKIGSVCVRDMRKSIPIFQVGGSSPASPTPPVSMVVLLQTK